MYDLDTLERLNLRATLHARGSVPIAFLTAVFTRSGIRTGYPGGVTAFCQDFPCSRDHPALLSFTSRSGGEMEGTLTAIEAKGLDLSTCCAVADFLHGPIDCCADIEFLPTRKDRWRPGWVATPVARTRKH